MANRKEACPVWTDNKAVTDDTGISFIGDSVLECLDLKRREHFGFPGGAIRSGDVLIYVSRDEELTVRTRSALMIKQKPVKKPLTIIIAALNNADVLPIVAETGDGEKTFETIFERIEVEVTENNGVVLIEAQGHRFEFDLSGTVSEAAVIMREDRVVYFTHPAKKDDCALSGSENGNESESGRDSAPGSRVFVGDMLESGGFEGYADVDKLRKKKLSEVVIPKIASALKELDGKSADETDENVPRVHVCGFGLNMIIEKRDFSAGGRHLAIYSFIGTKNAEKNLIDDSEKYAILSGVDTEIKLSSAYFNKFRLWGTSDKVRNVERLLEKCSGTNCTVLLEGESGTGKTVLARAIHDSSRRSSKPFVQVNCAAIPYQLMESELFGYEEGAFTGARRGGKKGLFEMAYGGTLFLDEITEIPTALQGRLLEALQSKTFYHVGGTKKLSVDVRLIVATNKNLEKLVREKKFREDLYYRINVFSIVIPPLRDRMDSIQAIISDILPTVCEELEVGTRFLSGGALDKIRRYSWPGNIRELRNVLERAAIMSSGKVITASDIVLPKSGKGLPGTDAEISGGDMSGAPKTLKERREEFEKNAIAGALEMFDGDKTAAAKYLGIGRTSIFEKINRYGLEKQND